MHLLCALLVFGAVTARSASVGDINVVYEWFKLDFTWKNDEAKLQAYVKNHYDARNNIIQNVRVWEDKAFLTLPRSKKGVPATLVSVPSVPEGHSASPHLKPFPSWEYQEVGNCKFLQNVQAIEIDPGGFLWVADSGTIEEFDFTDPVTKCPPKLLIFDIQKEELVSEFIFNRDHIRPGARLTDIVVDPKSKTAFISVVSDVDSAIFVYKHETKSAIKVGGLPAVMSTSVVVNGTEVPLALNKLSLALSLWQNLLYFAPSWEETLYSVDLSSLVHGSDVSSAIKPVGKLPGLCYAITMDSKHSLYVTVLEKDSIGKWDTTKKFEGGLKTIIQDESFLQFPTSFSFDRSLNIWIVSNRFQTYLNNNVNLEIPNFRLVKTYTGSDSYIFTPPQLSSASSLISSTIVVLVLILTVFR